MLLATDLPSLAERRERLSRNFFTCSAIDHHPYHRAYIIYYLLQGLFDLIPDLNDMNL